MSSAMDAQTQQLSSIIEKFISNGVNNLKVQDRYILPPHDRPQMYEVSYSESIPVIDLKDLDGPNRATVVHQIRHACEDDGFFQPIESIHLCWYAGINIVTVSSALTVLMQSDVSGLQVIKNGKWVSVEPIANAFVVNLGDQLQVVSNGRFRSVDHRAVTNMHNARISIPTFYLPSDDTFIAPATSMVKLHPALYKAYKFQEFLSAAWNEELKGKSVLDRFKI